MKIKTVEPIAVSMPMLKPIKMAGVELRNADNVLVRIETAEGIVGWGVSPTSPYLTEDVLARPLQFSEGHAFVPTGIGLGIEVDEQKVRRFTIER